jgi:superfamily II DNA or RNA helicase
LTTISVYAIILAYKETAEVARRSLSDPQVQQLIDQLLPLVVESGSVNKTCDRLNRGLADGNPPTLVYPNRLRALLSENPSRALNDATLELIKRGVEALVSRGEPIQADAGANLQAEVVKRWVSSGHTINEIREFSDEIALPLAVVRFLLQRAGELPLEPFGAHSPGAVETGARITQQPDAPDWSFQDSAIRRCLEALGVSQDRKVGLVLPTGAGKTRTALRIALSFLARLPNIQSRVLWVTHRKTLFSQAHRELQKTLIRDRKDLPENSVELLAKRVEFIMVSELAERLQDPTVAPALVIVDEAHHAAAISYRPLFETTYPLRCLFLTATPNRTDGLPIGIDEIPFTVTYRELADRGVIILPDFEDFPVPDFDWSEESLRDLADKIITRSAEEYTKVLVLAPRIGRVEEFFSALQSRLASETNHPLAEDDIGYVHSSGNSLRMPDGTGNVVRASTDEFLAHFAAKPRAIVVSAQLLLEGFDDPDINTVVITYPSASMILLMQAAGRCVRYAPGKTKSFVLQARNDSLAYHFDQRWLYQEISDYLRPQLLDFDYADANDLRANIQDLLHRYNVAPKVQQNIWAEFETVLPGERCRLLITGLPYYGTTEAFHREAQWSAILETPRTSEALRDLFNGFSALGAELSDPTDFLKKQGERYRITPHFSDGSVWRLYMDMLTSMYFARKEVFDDGSTGPQGVRRPFLQHGATTWLKYVTFQYRPAIPSDLSTFLQDCYNRDSIIALHQRERSSFSLALKVPLPLTGCQAHLLSISEAKSFQAVVEELRHALNKTEPAKQFAAFASYIAVLPAIPLPGAVLARLERYIAETDFKRYVLPLMPTVHPVSSASALTTPIDQKVEPQ